MHAPSDVLLVLTSWAVCNLQCWEWPETVLIASVPQLLRRPMLHLLITPSMQAMLCYQARTAALPVCIRPDATQQCQARKSLGAACTDPGIVARPHA